MEPVLTEVAGDDFDLDVRFEPVSEADEDRVAALKPSIASECCSSQSQCCA